MNSLAQPHISTPLPPDHDPEQVLFIPTEGAPVLTTRSVCAQIDQAAQNIHATDQSLSQLAANFFRPDKPRRSAQDFLRHLQSLAGKPAKVTPTVDK